MRNFLSSMFTIGIGIVFSCGLNAAPAQLNLQETNSTMLPNTQKRFAEKQRFQVFLQVEAVNENLVVNDFWREAKMNFHSAPDRLATTNDQCQHAFG